MTLLVQFQCLFYSFLFGFVMSGVYHIMNRFLYVVPTFIRYLFQVIIGCFFGILYFYGLVILNDGILRLYFFYWIFILSKVLCFFTFILFREICFAFETNYRTFSLLFSLY